MDYNAVLEVVPAVGGDDAEVADFLMEGLIEHHPAVAPAPAMPGAWQAIVTIPAHTLGQAVATARALARPLGELEGLEVLPTEVWDRRAGLEIDDVDLVGIAEAADLLGLTPQGVRDRIAAGSLPGRKIGRNWAVPRAALPRGGRPQS